MKSFKGFLEDCYLFEGISNVERTAMINALGRGRNTTGTQLLKRLRSISKIYSNSKKKSKSIKE